MPAADNDRALIELDAPAKVNLYLHVTGRRADGLHELDSLFVRTDAADRLTIGEANGLTLDVVGPYAPALAPSARDDNLVLKAARLLATEMGVAAKAKLVLEKNLPVAAGLGGGSADAAATLQALARYWSLDVAPHQLTAMAARLGADVPACLHREPLLVSGTGDVLGPAVVLPPVWLVLVNPGVALLTGPVFAARDGAFGSAMPLDHAPGSAADLAEALRARRNDLEPAAISLAPVIADVLAELDARPEVLLSRMSGSGATCFGLVGSAAEVRRAADAVANTRPDWWVRATSMLCANGHANPLPLAE